MFHRHRLLSLSVGAVLLILIGGVLVMTMLIPGMQRAREESRQNQCADNLSKIARAVVQYDELQVGVVPITSNSDGYYPSWAAILAPYVEDTGLLQLYSPANAEANLALIQSFNKPLWQCPSRRSGQVYDYPASFAPAGAEIAFEHAMPTDYAPGHSTTPDVWNVHADGVIINPLAPATIENFPVSALSFQEIESLDGISNTAMVGEKHMTPEWLGAALPEAALPDESGLGLDIPAFVAANSAASIRLAGDRLSFGALPLAPKPGWGLNQNAHAHWAFGSWHVRQAQFLRADGSVRPYDVDAEPIVLRRLLSRNDGQEELANEATADDAAGDQGADD